MVERRSVRVEGIVQGVGFRPFVQRHATRLGLAGFVRNGPAGAVIEAEGEPPALDELLRRIAEAPPDPALVAGLSVDIVPPRGETAFVIEVSRVDGDRSRYSLVGPDLATCPECLDEVRDPGARRHRYPFLSCTTCGPRYTITRAVPYDRARTSMAAFPLCGDCADEYGDPGDRRHHAQPLACAECGPTLSYRVAARGGDATAAPTGNAALEGGISALLAGHIVAIKGLGGYHLACLATDAGAVGRLRSAKRRPDKPLAVMVRDVAQAERIARLSDDDIEMLTSPARPIVLAPIAPASPVVSDVAPGLAEIGVMLPYTPLHHLLLSGVGAPLVMTSGNESESPIVFEDAEAIEVLGDMADAFLTHDRPIEARADDSVVRWMDGGPSFVRRSRGYAPAPLRLTGHTFARPTLALGGHLKNTFCFGRDDLAFLSPHVGDLESPDGVRGLREALEHTRRLFGHDPEVVAHDAHPEYTSTRVAEELGLPTVSVQHHHAHVASLVAEHGVTEPVLGVAFDGAGLGTDGAIWGGEFLLADGAAARRVGHFRYVPLPGGDAAAREPWRMAASHLHAAFEGGPDSWPVEVAPADATGSWPILGRMLETGLRSPDTSSVGRLFDAVAAILGLCEKASFEGQAAMRLEAAADLAGRARYRASVVDVDGGWRVDSRPLVREVARDAARGVPIGACSAGFHRAIAESVADVASRVRDVHGVARVGLTGGVFQNALLVRLAATLLRERGFEVLVHRAVPCNDGGLALGQTVIAAAHHEELPMAGAVATPEMEAAPCA